MKSKLLIIIGLIFNIVVLNSCEPNYDDIGLPEDVTGTLQIPDPFNERKAQDQNRLEFTFSIDGTEEVIQFEAFVADSIINSILTFSRNSTIIVENSFKVDKTK